MDALGVSFYGVQGLRYNTVVELGKLAEEQGFDGVFIAESFVNDGMATVQAIAMRTRRITVGAGIANVYLRHPVTLGAGAVAIDELSDGRLLLGLGVNHASMVTALGMRWEEPRTKLRDTTHVLRQVFTGEPLPGMQRSSHPALHPIPIHFAGVALETAELAGELADGLMLYLAPKARCNAMIERMQRGAERAGRQPHAVLVSHLIPTFLAEDLQAARQAARQFLSHYLALPVYTGMFHRCGFAAEVESFQQAMERGAREAASAALSDRLLDEVCLIGPLSRCQEHLVAFREAGITYPILGCQPVNEAYAEGARRIVQAFGGSQR